MTFDARKVNLFQDPEDFRKLVKKLNPANLNELKELLFNKPFNVLPKDEKEIFEKKVLIIMNEDERRFAKRMGRDM